MYCKVCGKKLPDDAVRCDECGTPVDGAEGYTGRNGADAHESAGGYAGGTDNSGNDNGCYYQDNRDRQTSYSQYYNGEEPVYERQSGARKGFAIASMVLGIIGLVGSCCSMMTLGILSLLLGVVGLIFGILGLKSQGKGMAIAGIVMACLNLVIGVLLLIMMLVSMDLTANMTYEQQQELEDILESLYGTQMIGRLLR